jgi:hypothetical protein
MVKMKKITLRLTWAEIMVLNDMASHYLREDSPMLTFGWDPPLDRKDGPIGVKTFNALRRKINDEIGHKLIKKKEATGRDWWNPPEKRRIKLIKAG